MSIFENFGKRSSVVKNEEKTLTKLLEDINKKKEKIYKENREAAKSKNDVNLILKLKRWGEFTHGPSLSPASFILDFINDFKLWKAQATLSKNIEKLKKIDIEKQNFFINEFEKLQEKYQVLEEKIKKDSDNMELQEEMENLLKEFSNIKEDIP